MWLGMVYAQREHVWKTVFRQSGKQRVTIRQFRYGIGPEQVIVPPAFHVFGHGGKANDAS